MGISQILAQIDREIALLQHARRMLAGKDAKPAAASRPATKRVSAATKKKRNLTPEGRRRIAEAVRRRWAEQKKGTNQSRAVNSGK